MGYTVSKQIDADFDDVVERVRNALSEEGFGVLTEIDMQATLTEKLDQTIEPYLVLGACNPSLASKAIEADRSIGALLPCNVVVRGANGGVAVDALDPGILGQVGGGAALEAVAADARERIGRVIAAL